MQGSRRVLLGGLWLVPVGIVATTLFTSLLAKAGFPTADSIRSELKDLTKRTGRDAFQAVTVGKTRGLSAQVLMADGSTLTVNKPKRSSMFDSV